MNGRDLIIFEKKGKEELEAPKKQKAEDPRNLKLKAIGLTNYADFKHPDVSEGEKKQREQLLKHKELALNKSPNLFISKTRLALRNLPLSNFYEKELKALF